MTIGVFDSGIGGLSVANAITSAMPEHDVIFKNDQAHMPYGDKPTDIVYEFLKPVIQNLLNEGAQVIVVACNTVTTTLITQLRADFDVPFVAVEPMVRPAAQATASGVIAVCATTSTLRSRRYAQLKQRFCEHITVLEPDCSRWAYMIEHQQLDETAVRSQINDVLEQGADQIVLGCTHYHWIEDQIKAIATGRAAVLQPEQALIRQLRRVLADLPA